MVDRSSRLVTLVVRRWWLLREVTVLPFTHIEYLWYGFGDLPINFGYTLQGAKAFNAVDWFNVALKVRGDSRPLLLFRFLGLSGIASEGLAMAFRARLLLRVLNLAGVEENQSRDFIHSLQHLLEVPVSSPMEQSVHRAMSKTAPCPHCGHALAVTARHCVYCGATFTTVLSADNE